CGGAGADQHHGRHPRPAVAPARRTLLEVAWLHDRLQRPLRSAVPEDPGPRRRRPARRDGIRLGSRDDALRGDSLRQAVTAASAATRARRARVHNATTATAASTTI